MSEPAVKQVQLPSSEDIRKINALLREDLTSDVRGEVADRLVMLAAREPHPRAKSAMFERAARLVVDFDSERSVILLRESFRQFPQVQVGQQLAAAGDEEPALLRLGRMSVLYDSVAAITEDAEERQNALITAIQYHIERGHGRRALAAIDNLNDATRQEEAVTEWQAAAEARLLVREAELATAREQLAAATDDARGAVLLDYARLLLEGDEPLSDASVALADAVESGADPTVAAPLWAEVARSVGEPEMLARALAGSLAHSESLHERMRVADELVNLPGVDERSPELAQRALETLVEAMPDDAGLRARLLVARSASGDTAADRELDRMRLEAVRNRDRAAEAVVCLALGRIARRQGNDSRVERYLRRVRTLDPRNSEALDFFEERYRLANDHKRLYLVLTHRLAISHGEELVRVALEMARLAEHEMANNDRAIEAYHRVLAVHPNNRLAMDGLERLYRATSRWPSLRDLLDRRARTLGSVAEATPETLAEGRLTLQALADLHLPQGVLADEEALFETYRRLLTCAPDDAPAADYLIVRYRSEGAWRPLASALEHRIESTEEPKERAAFARELHGVYGDHLDDHERARVALARVVADAPDDVDSIRLLELSCRRSGDEAGLLSALRRLQTLTEGDEQVSVLEEAAALASATDDTAAAIELYAQLQQLQPGHMAARRGLTRLYAAAAQHRELAELIDDRLKDEELERTERVELLEALVNARTDLSESAAAESAAAVLRELDPQSQVGSAAISRALLSRSDFGELRAMHDGDRDGARAYVGALRDRAENLPTVPRVRALLAAAEAEVSELRDPAAAAALSHTALTVLLETDDADADLISEVARSLLEHGEAAGNGGMQMIAAATLVEHSEGELQRMYMAQRVALCESEDDVQGASEAMTALLAARIAAADLDGISGTAERLGDLAELAGSEADVPALLVGFAELLLLDEDDAAKVDAALELLAQAAEQALLRGIAIEVARQAVDLALERRAQDIDLNRLLERVCSEQGDWVAVVDGLTRQAELLTEGERVDTLLRAASLCDGVLGDDSRAESLYRSVIAERPGAGEAWAGLLDMLRGREDRVALGAALEAFIVAPVDDPETRSRAAMQRIEMLADDGADGAAILAIAAPILADIALADALYESDHGILAAVAGRLEIPEDAPAAAEMLLPAVRKHARHDDVLRASEVLAQGIERGSDAHIQCLLDMAAMAAEELADPDRAWQQLREALIVAPQRADVFEQMAAFAAEQGRDDELDGLICALVDVAELEGVTALADLEQRKDLLQRWAAQAMGAERHDAAVQAWTLLHVADAEALEPLEVLEALYREADDGDAIAYVLSERLALGGEADELEAAWLRLADVHLSDRKEPAEAIEALQSGVQALPQSESLRAMLLQLLRADGTPADLAAALNAALAVLGDVAGDEARDERSLLQRELALLDEEGLEDPTRALASWRALLQADIADDQAAEHVFELLIRAAKEGLSPAQAEIAASFAETYDARGEYERVDALLTARIEAADGADRLPLWRRQAEVRATSMKDPVRAFDSLAAAICADPAEEMVEQMIGFATLAADALPPARVGAAFADAALSAEAEPRRALRLRAIEWLARETAEDKAPIAELYRAMLADDPADSVALDGLDALLQETGDAKARLAVLEARIRTSTEPEATLALRLEHARLAVEVGEEEGAIASFGELLDATDVDIRTEAIAALVELHETRAEHGPLADNLLRLSELSEDLESRVALSLRAAEHLVAADRAAEALGALRAVQADAATDVALHVAIGERLRADADETALVAHLAQGWQGVYAADAEHAEARLASATAQLVALANADPIERLALLSALAEAGLQDPEFDAALAALAAGDDNTVAADALDLQIKTWQSRGATTELAAARLDRLDRFADAVDARLERAELAALFENELGDPDAALAQWQQVVVADPADAEAVATLLRLSEATGQLEESEALLRAVVSELSDPQARKSLRMAAVERAFERSEYVRAADLLDEVLADDPGDEDAYTMRGAVLEELPGDDGLARQIAHFQHGIDHAPDPETRRLARTLLADLHHGRLSEPVLAFELVAAQLAETPEPDQNADLYRLAEVYAGQANITAPLWELLETEAEGTNDGAEAAARWGALALRCAAFEAAHDRARRFAGKALAHSAGDKTDAIEALAAIHGAAKTPDPSLVDLLTLHLRQTDPARVMAILRAEAEATEDPERRHTCLETAADIATDGPSEADLDPIGALIALAGNRPADETNWQRLQEAAGDENERVTEALLAAYEGAEEPEMRQRLMARAADLNQAAGESESAAAYLRMALEEVEDAELRQRLEAHLEAAGEFEALAIDLEDRAERDEEARTELLERALDIWLDRVGDPEHGLMVLDGLLALHPERVDLQDRRLDILRLQNPEQWLGALGEAIDLARREKDDSRLSRLLPKAIEHRLDDAPAPELHKQIAELAALAADGAAVCSLATRLMERLDDLEPAAALQTLDWVLAGTDAGGEPGTWMTAQLGRLDLLEDESLQIEALAALVTHASERLGDLDLAVEWQARALLLAPTDLAQARDLVQMADTPERAETALPALQATFEVAKGDVADVIALAAHMAEMAPGDPETWRILQQRCADATFCRKAGESLVPVLRLVGAAEQAIALQRLALQHAPAGERASGLLLLADDLAGLPDRALEAVQLLLDNAAEVAEPLAFIEQSAEIARAHHLLGEWLDGVEMLVAGEALDHEASLAAVALAAGVAASEQSDAVRAAELWTRAWDMDTDSEDARDAVLALRREADDAEQLATDLDRALMQGGGDAATELRMELARLCLDRLNRPGEALHQARAVLRDVAKHEVALALVEELSVHPAFGGQALELLEALHRGAERWAELAEVMARELANQGAGRQATRSLRELADLQQHRLGRPSEAVDTLLRLLGQAPTVALLERVVALAATCGREGDIAAAYELALAGEISESQRSQVLAAAAAFHGQGAERPEEVESLLLQLVESDPNHSEGWESLDALYDEAGRWDDLIALLRQRLAAATDEDQRRMVLHRLGGIAQATERLDVAIDAYERLAALDVDELEPAALATDLLRSANNPARLVDALMVQARRTVEDEDKARLMCEAARLRNERLDDPEGGADLYHRAFELSPASDEAFVFLERRNQDEPRQLMKLYRHRSGGVPSGPARTLILRKLATVCSHLGRGAEARAALEKAMLDDPGNPAVDEALLEICRKHEDFDGFRGAAERRLADEMPRLERIALLRELIRMAGDDDASLKWIDQLRDLVPDDSQLGVLQAMRQSRSDDPEQAAAGLEKVIRESDDEAAQVPLLERLAGLYAGPLDNSRKAIGAYQRILRLQPRRWEVHRALCDLYAARDSAEAQAECLRHWLGLLDEGSAERVPVLAELGALLVGGDQQAEALAAYQEAHGLDARNLDVLRPLAELLADAGQTESAADLQRKVVDALRRQRRRAEVPQAAAVAGGLLERLSRHEEARRMYRTALSMQPRHISALLGLGRTSFAVGDVDRAMVEFNRVAHHSGKGVANDDQAQAQVGLGRCWKAQGKRRQARACFNSALELQPGLKEAVEELATL